MKKKKETTYKKKMHEEKCKAINAKSQVCTQLSGSLCKCAGKEKNSEKPGRKMPQTRGIHSITANSLPLPEKKKINKRTKQYTHSGATDER